MNRRRITNQLLVAFSAACLGSLLTACAATHGSSASIGAEALPTTISQGAFPATTTHIRFEFQTVDDPNSNTNEVTDINQRAKIVGTFGGGSASNIPESYSAESPYTKFRRIEYPDAQGTVATSLTTNKIVAGYVIDPNSVSGISAFARINGLWTLLTDSNEGTSSNAITEILGINDSENAVGFYVNSSGIDIPFELNVPQETFTDLDPPGAIAAQATGINGRGDVSGWETTSGGTVGWFLKVGTYYPVSYQGAVATYALSLNWQEQVVGDYQDSQGAIHGFLLTYPERGGAKQIWQTIDDPAADGETVVTGINNHDAICGWYVDKSGAEHGFVATSH